MNIAPKLSTDLSQYDEEIFSYINESLEIQLLSLELVGLESTLHKLKAKKTSLNTFILHVPLEMCDILQLYAGPTQSTQFNSLLQLMGYVTEEIDVTVYIIVHSVHPVAVLAELGCITWLKTILVGLTHTRVNIAVENGLPYLNTAERMEGASDLVAHINHDNLCMCFDTCHWQASYFLLGGTFKLNKEAVQRIKLVHFSATLNKDGIRDKTTHGCAHFNVEHVYAELHYLQSTVNVKFDKIILVTEIANDDYFLRANLKQELKYLKQVQEERQDL